MHYEFTSAALRALDAAARFAPPDADGRWRLPELLLALALEEESRAGSLLSARQINAEKVRERWPVLAAPVLCEATGNGATNGHAEPPPPSVISRDLRVMLRSISARLGHLEPFVVATDHLLWGLLDVPGEVGEWLGRQGFDARSLEAEILRAENQHDQPLAIPENGEAAAETGFLSIPEDEPPMQKAVTVSENVAAIEPRTPSVSRDALAERWEHAEAGQPRSARGEVAVLRLLDAAGNRAREAIRVLEDYARFVLDDRHLTEALKHLRHDLAAALAALPLAELLAARDTPADVGVDLSTAAEERRRGPADVATANFKRAQEALRTLEEFGKLRAAALGLAMKQLRYRAYTLERAVRTTARRGSLADASLYVLLDGRSNEAEFCQLAEQLVAAGVDVLQLRDKQLDDRALLGRAKLLRQITAAGRTLFIMNDRADLAALAEADGVHVGQAELAVHAARSIVGAGCLVGVSTHSQEQARQAVLDGADYIGIGPTFPSGTKAFDSHIGVEVVAAVCGEIRLPTFAIGGIDLENLNQVMAAGCRRVAVSGAVCRAADPAAAARRLRDTLLRSGE